MHGELPKGLLSPGKTRRNLILALLLVVLAAFAIHWFTTGQPSPRSGGRGRGGAEGPVPVLAVASKRADVPVYLDAVGTVRALNTVTVRSQVDGKLIDIAFTEGQDVKKGDIIARIDPTTFKAQLDQAIAKKAQDEAQLQNARIDLDRYEKLAVSNSINRQQADTQRAMVAQLEALVNIDQGAIDNARAILDYTSIVAPIDGRTGIRQVDIGNIIHASDTSGIVVITQVKPISVLFNLPQQYLDPVNKAFAKAPLTVVAQRSDNTATVDTGTLTVVDNQVDQSTGTVRLKAEFPNADLQQWPGQFVNVRLLIDTMKQVVVIPTGAVQRGPNGTFVYVVKDGAVAMRGITVAKQDEVQAVVSQGVQPPEQVVTTGFARLTDGAKVAVSDPNQATPAAPAPANRQRGDGRRRQQGGAAAQ